MCFSIYVDSWIPAHFIPWKTVAFSYILYPLQITVSIIDQTLSVLFPRAHLSGLTANWELARWFTCLSCTRWNTSLTVILTRDSRNRFLMILHLLWKDVLRISVWYVGTIFFEVFVYYLCEHLKNICKVKQVPQRKMNDNRNFKNKQVFTKGCFGGWFITVFIFWDIRTVSNWYQTGFLKLLG